MKTIRLTPDYSRDSLLTYFGIATVKDRYLLSSEKSPQDMFVRVAEAYADDQAHAERIYRYMSSLHFMPATPILSNGGTDRGLPISCFVNECEDSMAGIKAMYSENIDLAMLGGGIGSYVGNIRSIGEKISDRGETAGVIPFLKVIDSMTLAINQGSLRRGSAAVYLPVWHPEIEEFVALRKAHGGDMNRRCLNLNHAVVIEDQFMNCVDSGTQYPLVSPKTKEILKWIDARELWGKITETRLETGEPYILFIDNVNRKIPEHHRRLGLKVKTSQLCNEIHLPTGRDHDGKERTAVCCLSSLNLEKYDEWKDNKEFILDVYRFLDNVLTDFCKKAPPSLAKAVYSATQERSVGLGVMGFHGFLQSKGIPFGCALAKSWNKKLFKHIRAEANEANITLGHERGSNPDWNTGTPVGFGPRRFSYLMAIAPTASISTICGGASPGIDPFTANAVTHKTLSGTFTIKNKYLEDLLVGRGFTDEERESIWSQIVANGGRVSPEIEEFKCDQRVDSGFIRELDVFKTALELDQLWIIEHAADRAPEVDQGQSVNIWLPGDTHKSLLHKIHFAAWKKGIKGLYYCRSTSRGKAENVSSLAPTPNAIAGEEPKECLACQ